MARYTGPVCRLCRREGEKLFLKGDRCYSQKCSIERREGPPGVHNRSRGRFSAVESIEEIYGSYAEAGGHAGVTRSAEGRVMTKGEVSLSLGGNGRGVDLGFAFGAFIIGKG